MSSRVISVRFTDEEIEGISTVVDTVSRNVPVSRHRLIKEAIRRGLRALLISAHNNDAIVGGVEVRRGDAFSIASPNLGLPLRS